MTVLTILGLDANVETPLETMRNGCARNSRWEIIFCQLADNLASWLVSVSRS